MSKHTTHRYELDDDEAPTRTGQLSSNGHWIFGSVYACLTLLGFGFGVWAGAAKPPEAKQKDDDKPLAQAPPKTQPQGQSQPPSEPTPDPKGGSATEPKGGSSDPKPEPKGGTTPEPKGGSTPPKLEPKGGTTAEPKGGTTTTTPPPKPKDPPPKVRQVAFKEIQPILMNYCGTCHGQSTGKPKGGIDLRTVASIMRGGNNGDIVKVNEPLKSKLYTSLLPGAAEPMPPDGKPGPPQKEMMLIHDWIASGAKPRRTIRRRGGLRCGNGGNGRSRLELTPEPPAV